MHKTLLALGACLACTAAGAQQSAIDEALEAPMQALDSVADLNQAIDEDRRRTLAPASATRPMAVATDDVLDDELDEEQEEEVEEKNAFSGLEDDFEHDDVDIYNAPDLIEEDDFEEDEEVDQEQFID